MKRGNRKLTAAWLLTLLTTAMFVSPTLATSIAGVIGLKFVWVLISGTEWITFNTLIWGGYFASNVVEKHTSFLPDTEYNKLLSKEDLKKEDTEELI